ncbi:MAG: hypothetical protein LM577_07565 [Thermoproteaceae archaeon]|nr:hypothetical protein [Thermoproteaceae archaeon]
MTGEVRCIKRTFERCSPLGVTTAIIERVKGEPPGVKRAAHLIWHEIVGELGAKAADYELLWTAAGLEPIETVSREDLQRARQLVEEALKECEVCVVDLAAFLSLVERVVIAARPSGEPVLVIELSYRNHSVTVVTKLSAWVKRSKDEVKYVVPLTLRERLRLLGLAVDAPAEHLYLELTRVAERYEQVTDAFVKPILYRALQRARADPSAARCSRDGGVLYIAADIVREQVWAYDAHVGLGRNAFYRALWRLGLLAGSEPTVPVTFVGEHGEPVKKRALALSVERLAELLEVDVRQICDELEASLGAAGEEAHEAQSGSP